MPTRNFNNYNWDARQRKQAEYAKNGVEPIENLPEEDFSKNHLNIVINGKPRWFAPTTSEDGKSYYRVSFPINDHRLTSIDDSPFQNQPSAFYNAAFCLDGTFSAINLATNTAWIYLPADIKLHEVQPQLDIAYEQAKIGALILNEDPKLFKIYQNFLSAGDVTATTFQDMSESLQTFINQVDNAGLDSSNQKALKDCVDKLALRPTSFYVDGKNLEVIDIDNESLRHCHATLYHVEDESHKKYVIASCQAGGTTDIALSAAQTLGTKNLYSSQEQKIDGFVIQDPKDPAKMIAIAITDKESDLTPTRIGNAIQTLMLSYISEKMDFVQYMAKMSEEAQNGIFNINDSSKDNMKEINLEGINLEDLNISKLNRFAFESESQKVIDLSDLPKGDLNIQRELLRDLHPEQIVIINAVYSSNDAELIETFSKVMSQTPISATSFEDFSEGLDKIIDDTKVAYEIFHSEEKSKLIEETTKLKEFCDMHARLDAIREQLTYPFAEITSVDGRPYFRIDTPIDANSFYTKSPFEDQPNSYTEVVNYDGMVSAFNLHTNTIRTYVPADSNIKVDEVLGAEAQTRMGAQLVAANVDDDLVEKYCKFVGHSCGLISALNLKDMSREIDFQLAYMGEFEPKQVEEDYKLMSRLKDAIDEMTGKEEETSKENEADKEHETTKEDEGFGLE